MTCIGCGCNDGLACVGGCSWTWHVPPICSRCWRAFKEIIEGPEPEQLNGLPDKHPAVRIAASLKFLVEDLVVHHWARNGGAACGARWEGNYSATTQTSGVTCPDCRDEIATAAARRRGALQ